MKSKLAMMIVLIASLIWPQITLARPGGSMTIQLPTTVAELPNFTQISACELFTCALTASGGVKCWGDNTSGQLGDGTITRRITPVDVTGLTSGVNAITTGNGHACVLTTSSGVKCWGTNGSGQLGDGTTTDRKTPVDVIGLAGGVKAIAAGGGHTCAITMSGGVKCWGANGAGQLGDSTTTNHNAPVDVTGLASGVSAITTGSGHTCALLSSGGVKCWGANLDGQLGDGTTITRNAPVDVTGLPGDIKTIAAGESHTCALTTNGGVKCWGYNRYGQLGDGTIVTRRTPVGVYGLESGVSAIAGGTTQTCALTTSGAAKCWGDNSHGQLGDSTTKSRSTPVDVFGLLSGISAIAAGGVHTCALTVGGGIKCWGDNLSGQLGDGTITQRSTPVDVVGLVSGMSAIAAGGGHTCALTAGGGVRCWGANGAGQLGDGTNIRRSTSVEVTGLTSGVRAITTGSGHTCALTATGGAKCWGYNISNQLGDGTSELHSSPVDVVGLASGVNAIGAGESHTCALTSGGGVMCWGANWFGQLGNTSTSGHSKPQDVFNLTSGVSAIAVGDSHTCALTTGDGVKCWGANSSGQLGDGTTTQRTAPVNVVGLASGVKAITTGEYHTCTLSTGGGVKCWGNNQNGQLGDGTTTTRIEPVDVAGLASGVQAIAAGGHHTCALTSGGGIKCWGGNEYGQLGDGATTPSSIPVDVAGMASGVSVIATGYHHTCAVTTGGRTRCWGWDFEGQLGIGTYPQRLTPVEVVENVPARISFNYLTSKPGSYLTLTGENFSPGSKATLAINGRSLTDALQIDATGSFIIFLNTADADAGSYCVAVGKNPATSGCFTLYNAAPLRHQEGGGQTLTVPAGIAIRFHFVYLPMTMLTSGG